MLRRILIGLAGLLVVVAVAVGAVLWWSRPPDPGPFYEPPESAATAAPGTLLRAEPLAPAGLPAGARAWRILYASAGAGGQPVAVSGLVVAGAAAREAAGPRPVLAWAHGTVGTARGCAPSLLPDPLGVLPQPLNAVLDQGWVVVATDYAGLGGPGVHPYLVADAAARDVIDSVRAARALGTGLDLGRRYAVWGESQGGHAALATGVLAARGYAPELTLVGVGAAAPATDLGPLMEAALGTTPGKVLTSLAVDSWTRVFPELSFDGAVARRARPLVRAIAARCLFPHFAVVAGLTAALPRRPLRIDVTRDARWARRLRENTPDGRIAAPVLLAQGQDDQIVDPAVQRRWVARRCAAGQAIDLRELPGIGHLDVMRGAGALLIAWTRRLLAGEAVRAGCRAG